MSYPYIPGLAGVPAIESSISSIDGKKGILFYRGYPIGSLAKHSTFEAVAFLLNHGQLPNDQQLFHYQTIVDEYMQLDCSLEAILSTFDQTTHPIHVLQAVFPMLNHYLDDTASDDRIQAFLLAQGAKIMTTWEKIRTQKSVTKPLKQANLAENFLYMLTGEKPTKQFQHMMDVCLILHAEHTTNASTFANLVVASTLAKPCSVISSAIGALSGPLHGGANEQVINMLHEIGSVDQVEAYIEKNLRQKSVIWGMGHREYSTKDPRAIILEQIVRELMVNEKQTNSLLAIALKIEAVCEKHLGTKGVYPNVDFYSGIVYEKMGIPVDQFTSIFALSRISGWQAHLRQQLENNKIFRPTQIYTGVLPRDLR